MLILDYIAINKSENVKILNKY